MFCLTQVGRIFEGNMDSTHVKKNEVNPPLVGRFVRLIVRGYIGFPVLQWQLYGYPA